MAPEQASPHWDRIVGKDWPQIPPAAWHDLETAARDGAEALNLADVEQARRAFDEVVQESVGLAQIRTALVALEENPRAFAKALVAAADTFGAFGDLVRRTRNQILDVVRDATDRIEEATSGDNNDDGVEDDEAEAAADRRATEKILDDARGDVVDIVAAALTSLGPQGLPRLDDIALALGQPGPWRTGGRVPGTPHRKPLGDHHRPGDKRPGRGGRGYEAGPWAKGFDKPMRPDPILGQILIDLLDDLLHPTPGPSGSMLPPGTNIDVPVGRGEMPGAPLAPTDPNPGHAPAVPGHGTPGFASPGGRSDPAAPEAGSGGGDGGAGIDTAAVDEPAGAPRAGRTADETELPDGSDVSAGPDRDLSAHSGDDPLENWNVTRGNGAHSATDSDTGSAAPAVPPLLPAAMNPAPGATAAPAVSSASAGGASVSSTPAAAASGPGAISSAQATRGVMGPVDAHRAPGATGKALTPGSAPGVSAAVGKAPVPLPDGDSGAGKHSGAGELVQTAVGAAMISASAPTFVVGERVDGDLVLARTLLGGIRAATDSWVVGVDWAVAVLRHPSGVSAFVTSNEGRGWLPARLHLPSEVSLPWLWAVAEGSGWEGIADPARILVEFAIAWGAKSGAKLSALASSQPIDPVLGRQLGAVSLAGSVPPSDTMDLRAPAPGTLDRLGITAAPRLLDRAAKVADNAIALRCLELAVDAHTRVERAELPAVDAMGAPEIRLRILRALRDGRDFADSWWEEIQDADDLIAATALGHRAETSRIGLGELRSDAADLEPGSELSVLRTLTFHRRCNELVLLLAEEKSRQTLRDAVYAHTQVLAHPLFVPPPAAAPAPRRATISTGPAR